MNIENNLHVTSGFIGIARCGEEDCQENTRKR